MSTLIVSTFPDCGKYNPIKINKKFANIYVNRHRRLKDTGEINPEFPGNYLDVVGKCMDKFEVVLVSSNPNIRHQLCEKFPKDIVVIYPKGDKETLKKFSDILSQDSTEADQKYISSVERNWDRWHKEAELFCIENNIPYYEVGSTEEANVLIEKLADEHMNA
ncbi:MAG: hypothetical protein MJZ34_03170 [Paludibacteraceae bacterium]|nr:hypothetical protein [Paludibacteraceae bacterium]